VAEATYDCTTCWPLGNRTEVVVAARSVVLDPTLQIKPASSSQTQRPIDGETGLH